MGMLDLGRTDAAAVPLPEQNRGFIFFDLQGRLNHKKDDGSIELIIAGRDGLNGATGVQGVPGEKGDQGLRGLQGDRGLQGVPGGQGVPGANGAQGVPGTKGDAGQQGLKGDQGVQGVPGANGAPGQNGLKGDKGDVGAQGVAGVNGAQGVPGAKGDQGVPGANGAQGVPGAAGAQGVPGVKGDAGQQGAKGDQGVQGVPGANGADSVPASRLIAISSTSISNAGQVLSLGVLNLTAAEIAAGASVDLSVFGVSAVGSASNGRMAMRLIINGNTVAQAVQGAAMGANNSVQAFRLSGKIIIQGARADWVLEQLYGANLAQQVGQATGLSGVAIEVQAVIQTASAGFTVSPRAVSLKA